MIGIRLFTTLLLGIYFLASGTILSADPVKEQRAADSSILAPGESFATPYFQIEGELPGPVFIILGGVHGDEPAGWQTVCRLKGAIIDRGRLILLPFANKRTVREGVRKLNEEGDLNRSFPGDIEGQSVERLAGAIFQLIKDSKADVLLDLHESLHFHLEDNNYLGQTIIAYQDPDCLWTAYQVVEDINESIAGTEESFTLLHQPVRGSTSWAAGSLLKIPAFTIETCQELVLEKRIDYQLTVVKKIMARYGVELLW